MFLIDSITNRRSTEPTWFRFFRNVFAITLMGIIMYYLITQFEKIGMDASTIVTTTYYEAIQINMSVRTGNFNEMKIDYPNNVTVYKHKPYYQDVSMRYNSSTYSNQFNITITANNSNSGTQQYLGHDLSIPINSLFLVFESFEYYVNDVINSTYTTPEPRNFLLSLGQLYIIYFKPIGYELALDLDLRLEQLPIELKSNEIQIQILESGNTFRYETKKYDITDLISNLGGFYGGIAGIFVLFFGMNKHEPWGLAQKYFFSYTPCRRSLKRKFAKKYVSSAGIPLVEEVNKRPKKLKESKKPKEPEELEESLKENVESLEERIQILETLLEDYYLDVYYLKKVKKVITKHAKQEDLLKKYKQNEAESIDKKTKTIDENESITVEIPIDENESNTAVDEEAG